MQDIEQLGVFYLGRHYDMATQTRREEPILYNANHLVTHALCVGMTGSGKTGLCISLLEEAAIDGIPAIVIDPKGDLGNLALAFPNLLPTDFAPWIDEQEAARKNVTVGELAASTAAAWRAGLAEWGQGPERIARLRDACEIAIYTPGSTAGRPVSIVGSLAAPPQNVLDDDELLRERVDTTVTGLLGLVGVSADPLQSREHVLLATILEAEWRAGRAIDLPGLVALVQNPGIERVGVLDLETFFSSKDRFSLVMSLNNVLAAPSFAAWLSGDPLDVQSMLYTKAGKPKISIVSIAHLDDASRMFFVSLLLEHMLGWVRQQSGTSSLRALLYMDEIFGYFPPVANPPSKRPLLTLLKQARAFGVGVVLATQNPVDLDYKGLANCGTWMIGRLQAERDKLRVLDGLEGAASGTTFDRAALETTLSGLGNRVFLLHDVHAGAPVTFQTRWALSYLRGPLTRSQLKTLNATLTQDAPAVPAPGAPANTPTSAATGTPRPAVPPDVPQHFLPVRTAQVGELFYMPMLYGAARVGFVDAKKNIDVSRDVSFLTPITDGAVGATWDHADAAWVAAGELARDPAGAASYATLPGVATRAKQYAGWTKALATWLCESQRLEMMRSPSSELLSVPGEDEVSFRMRVTHARREERDLAVVKLREKYAPKVAALDERIRRGEDAISRELAEVSAANTQTAISIGSAILGVFGGSSATGRAATAARGAARARKQATDVERARAAVDELRAKRAGLVAEVEAKAQTLSASMDPSREALEIVAVKPKKAAVTVQLVSLAWAPFWRSPEGAIIPAWVQTTA